MAQKGYCTYMTVHPSGIVEVSGKTDSGREIAVYLGEEVIEKLHKVLDFAQNNGTQLGHAFWHIDNHHPDHCEIC